MQPYFFSISPFYDGASDISLLLLSMYRTMLFKEAMSYKNQKYFKLGKVSSIQSNKPLIKTWNKKTGNSVLRHTQEKTIINVTVVFPGSREPLNYNELLGVEGCVLHT